MRIAVGNRVSDWFAELNPIFFPSLLCLVPPSIEPFWASVGQPTCFFIPSLSMHQCFRFLPSPKWVTAHTNALPIPKYVILISLSTVFFVLVDLCHIYSFSVFLGVRGNDRCGQSTMFY